MANHNEPVVTVNDLPMSFNVKYLGFHPAKGLWGMKHTRKPVDYLVSQAKNLPASVILPMVRLQVTGDGVDFVEITGSKKDAAAAAAKTANRYSVDVISYGVQDLVYTRVFSMIVVIDDTLDNGIPFECHSFVCDSRDQARRITYALAAAFQDYGRRMKETEGPTATTATTTTRRRFAIDLRTPEEQAAASDDETEA